VAVTTPGIYRLVETGAADVIVQGKFGGVADYTKAQGVAVKVSAGTLVLDYAEGVGPANFKNFKITWKGAALWASDYAAVEDGARFSASLEDKTARFEFKESGLALEVVLEHDWMRVQIHQQKSSTGQEGVCGNFDGDQGNDAYESCQARRSLSVSDSESLFN
jgi:hypothetical protein